MKKLIAIAVIVIAFIAFLLQIKQTNKYYRLACIESDIIRNCNDCNNPDVYDIAQDYLNVIGFDTNILFEYSYCY